MNWLARLRPLAARQPHLLWTSRDEEQIKSVFKAVIAQLGKIDILVNNAGITRDQLIMRMKRADWDAVLNTNLTSAYLCTQQAIGSMLKQRWGRIINITSIFGQTGQAGQANYASSKAGLIGLTMAVAREVASRNITCNAVAPGFIETAMTAGLGDEFAQKAVEDDSTGARGHTGRCGQCSGILGLRRSVLHYRACAQRERRHADGVALPAGLAIVQAESPTQIAQARELFMEYARSLDFNLCFQSFRQRIGWPSRRLRASRWPSAAGGAPESVGRMRRLTQTRPRNLRNEAALRASTISRKRHWPRLGGNRDRRSTRNRLSHACGWIRWNR